MCVFLCESRDDLWANGLLQTSHEYGFSPVCIRLCDFRFQPVLNIFLHTSHSKGILPEWIRMCLARVRLSLNALLQIVHLNGLASLWIRICLWSSVEVVFLTWQTVQTYFFIPETQKNMMYEKVVQKIIKKNTLSFTEKNANFVIFILDF